MTLRDEIEPSIRPGDDFYNHVNKKWRDSNPVPDDKSRTSAFNVLSDANNELLHGALKAKDGGKSDMAITLVKRFFAAGMNEAAIERGGLDAIRPALDEVAGLADAAELAGFIGRTHAQGRGLMWAPSVEPDDKDSARYLVRLHQSGLGLPDRDYYFNDDERSVSVRTSYRKFLERFFTLLGSSDAAADAKSVYDLETKLAAASNTSTQNRDVDAMYNLYPLDRLGEVLPGIDWTAYLKAIGLTQAGEILVSQPTFITAVLKLTNEVGVDAWKPYLQFHLVRPLMSKLPRAYEDLSFSFYGTVLGGATEQEPRYRRLINLAAGAMPEPLGRLYVEQAFDEDAKRTIATLVTYVQAALGARIDALDWMSDATKKLARVKLNTFLPLLGYPDTWRDYTDLELGDHHAANMLAIAAFEWSYEVSHFGTPVDRRQWLMSPAAVNAYYWATTNGITFPAAILQPPFFDAGGDMAANFGGIGAVIGHEIIHGFDDKGSKFDHQGNLKSWWTPADRTAFDARTAKLRAQYDACEVDGVHVNGELTLGENVADLGGVLIALDALERYGHDHQVAKDIDGFSPVQRLFLSQARIWRGNIRPELSHVFLISDPHAPAVFRVNGVVSNIDVFYVAFDVKPDDALFKLADERLRIW